MRKIKELRPLCVPPFAEAQFTFQVSQPQSITQKGVHTDLLRAREREQWFLQGFCHFWLRFLGVISATALLCDTLALSHVGPKIITGSVVSFKNRFSKTTVTGTVLKFREVNLITVTVTVLQLFFGLTVTNESLRSGNCRPEIFLPLTTYYRLEIHLQKLPLPLSS